ncbi:MAG: AbrB/MazE/SpoVT family DNA-binding domain-containing protein [Proteobacteria bacterium]|nr:AbrB/MazE/SpoVT family DNA-binding domain-containing protein [Pseudomonadota bacterium]MCH8000093.1 AbrB/MazE/SpoVT family DNA-binding domain-containing protein [Pseudomonadota bacterium]
MIRKGGVIQLPGEFLKAMGVAEGDQVQLALDGDIARILSRAAALREAQELVRRYVPEGVSLVDELLAERRADAAREGR